MSGVLGEFTVEQFLGDYWQKKPCLVRGALPGFRPEFDENDLAGLATVAYAESRLISGSYPAHDWTLRNGPFAEADFAGLPDTGWTLLVQDVEKHYPPLQSLLQRFDFLPQWRLDDLMISYATPGGSVGPHVDQYDVFLVQATGQRLWQIAAQFDTDTLPDCPLDVLQHFEPEREWVLHPGDMLYLPPGIAHHGVAVDAGMTWSVGLRAPSAADLLVALGEALAETEGGGPRYSDPDPGPSRPGEITAEALERMRSLLVDSAPSAGEFERFAGHFITRFRLAAEPANPGPALDARGLFERLQSGQRLVRNPWTRLAWIPQVNGAVLFAAGESIDCSAPLAQALCAGPEPDLFSSDLGEQDHAAVLALVNGGHLVWSED